jgi:hypothetical protein
MDFEARWNLILAKRNHLGANPRILVGKTAGGNWSLHIIGDIKEVAIAPTLEKLLHSYEATLDQELIRQKFDLMTQVDQIMQLLNAPLNQPSLREQDSSTSPIDE